MALTMDSIITKAELKPPRILILGMEKIGKTEFASGTVRDAKGKVVEYGANKPIILPINLEEGADSLPVARFPALKTYGDVMDALSLLYESEHEYETCVIDSASALQPIIRDAVCKEEDVDSIRKVKGFRVGEESEINKWRDMLAGMTALRDERGMASIIIGHVKVGKAKDPEAESYDSFQFDVESAISEVIRRWADIIFFANYKYAVRKDEEGFKQKRTRAVSTGGERVLCTQFKPTHPGGGRGVYGRIPDELPLDWGAFMNAVAKAAEA